MRFRVILLGLLCGSLTGCLGDHTTGLKLQSGERPVFAFSGGGFLQGFSFRDISQSSTPTGEENRLWVIKSVSYVGKHVLDVATLEYGVVPAGYRQTFPEGGNAPKRLIDGSYLAECVTADSICRPLFFKVQNGKVMAADNQLLIR
jgi:hypothetical protein